MSHVTVTTVTQAYNTKKVLEQIMLYSMTITYVIRRECGQTLARVRVSWT